MIESLISIGCRRDVTNLLRCFDTRLELLSLLTIDNFSVLLIYLIKKNYIKR